MTIEKAVNSLSVEMAFMVNQFNDLPTFKKYIRLAIMVGMEHFRPTQIEITAMDQEGNTVGEYRSAVEASEKLEICRQGIMKVLIGERHTAGGLIFIKSEDKFINK